MKESKMATTHLWQMTTDNILGNSKIFSKEKGGPGEKELRKIGLRRTTIAKLGTPPRQNLPRRVTVYGGSNASPRWLATCIGRKQKRIIKKLQLDRKNTEELGWGGEPRKKRTC